MASEQRIIHLHGGITPQKIQANQRYQENRVRTSTYNIFNFIPYNMLRQFTKAANMYFLVISIMQCIRDISITNGQPANLPALFLIVLISMIKDAFEDYRRYKRDEQENNTSCITFDYDTNQF